MSYVSVKIRFSEIWCVCLDISSYMVTLTFSFLHYTFIPFPLKNTLTSHFNLFYLFRLGFITVRFVCPISHSSAPAP